MPIFLCVCLSCNKLRKLKLTMIIVVLKANSKIAPYRKRIVIDNWDDICILFSQDRADGQGSRTIQENIDEIEVDSATIPDSLDKCDEVDAISELLARKKRKETTSSSCSLGPKKKTSSTTIISDCMQRMATDFSDYLAVERKKSELLLAEKELMLAEKKKLIPKIFWLS